ncbi:MAG TPA: PilZ domain-containing protein [Hyphomicrobium sp.]|nr:PilZ domain-containing protein [Hyphomicrobium sp.]
MNEDALPIEKPPERRQFGRRAVFKSAVIVLNDGRRLAGAVVDFSDAGARIKLPEAVHVESEFELEIPGDDFVVRCRLAHADDVYIGVQYIKPPRRISWLKR